MKPNGNAGKKRKTSQSDSVERFQQTVELSKAAYQNHASVDVDAPMDKTVFRRITMEEKNAQHFAFHREFYERERSK
jgi:hypothetical protein